MCLGAERMSQYGVMLGTTYFAFKFFVVKVTPEDVDNLTPRFMREEEITLHAMKKKAQAQHRNYEADRQRRSERRKDTGAESSRITGKSVDLHSSEEI